MIICAGDIESFDFAKPIGIGLINSAINLTQLILTYCPDKLIFIGTAGSYGNNKVLDVVVSSCASNLEIGFLENKSYTPLDNVIKNKITDSQNHPIVNSSNYITTDFELARRFLGYGITIENMEFFSVVSCAKKFNIDVIGIFVVTNYCNKNAHTDFITNHGRAKEILVNYVQNNLKGST